MLASIRLFARAARQVPFLTIRSFASQYKTDWTTTAASVIHLSIHTTQSFLTLVSCRLTSGRQRRALVILPRVLYPKHSLPRRERAAIARQCADRRRFGTTGQSAAFLTTFYNRIIVGLQSFTKCGEKDTATGDSRAHIALQDSIVTLPSKKTAHNKAQLEKPSQSARFSWHSLDLAESNLQGI